MLSLVLIHLTFLPRTWDKDLTAFDHHADFWCGIPSLLEDGIRILEADMEGSDQASKVNYSKDDYRFLHEAALNLSIRTRWGVKIDIVGEQA